MAEIFVVSKMNNAPSHDSKGMRFLKHLEQELWMRDLGYRRVLACFFSAILCRGGLVWTPIHAF